MRVAINNALDERLEELTSQVDDIQKFAVEPLSECEQMIEKQISTASSLLSEGGLHVIQSTFLPSWIFVRNKQCFIYKFELMGPGTHIEPT